MLRRLNQAFIRSRKEDGFTLIELLIVIIIIGILAAIAIPIFLNQQKAAQNAAVQSDARNTIDNIGLALTKDPEATDLVIVPQSQLPAGGFVSVAGDVKADDSTGTDVGAVLTADDWATLTDIETGTSAGSSTDYLLHVQSASTGYWVEYNSQSGTTTKSTDADATPVVAHPSQSGAVDSSGQYDGSSPLPPSNGSGSAAPVVDDPSPSADVEAKLCYNGGNALTTNPDSQGIDYIDAPDNGEVVTLDADGYNVTGIPTCNTLPNQPTQFLTLAVTFNDMNLQGDAASWGPQGTITPVNFTDDFGVMSGN